MIAFVLILFAYLLGSIPTGYWLVKAFKGIDLRTVGSCSTGATNVLRVAGKGPAAIVFLVDVGKGILPVCLAVYVLNHYCMTVMTSSFMAWLPFAVAAAAIIGHSKSIFLKFQGGKSAATGLGTMIAMNPAAAACAFAVFLGVMFFARIVSLATMTAVLSSAIFMYLFGGHVSYIIYCLLGAAYVIYRHKANIKRLLSGTEPRLGQKPATPSGK